MTPRWLQVEHVGEVGVVEAGVQQRRVGVLEGEARVDQLGCRAVHRWPEPVPGVHCGPSSPATASSRPPVCQKSAGPSAHGRGSAASAFAV